MNYTCPYCRKKPSAEKPLFPFCSERCKLSDLGHWAREDYRVPGKHIDRDDDDEFSDAGTELSEETPFSHEEEFSLETPGETMTRHIDLDDDD